jgi:lia operon protein LiaF
MVEEWNMNQHFLNKTIWGLVLIGAGVLFLLNQTGTIDLDLGFLIANFWPVILIFIGLKGMIIRSKMGHGWGGSWNAIIALAGTYFLLRNLNVSYVEDLDIWQFIVPAVLIFAGLGMLTRGPGSRYEERKAAYKLERREERERRRQERDEARERRHQERHERRHADYGHKGHKANAAVPPEEPDPVYDPAYTRKIEQDLDQVFHERVVKKLGDDPFPLVSDAGVDPRAKKEGEAGSHTRDEPKSAEHDRDYAGYTPPGQSYGSSWNAGWQHEPGRRTVERSNFIGDIHLGQEYWQLEPTNVSHFIGDTIIDLTKANIPFGETKLTVSAFIGDVKVFVPNDIQLEISVSASAFIGDMKVMDRYESGLFRNMKYDSLHYSEADKKINLTVSMFIGDITVKRVG